LDGAVTLLAEKAGVARHTFLEFINRSVMGSGFTQYKSAALVNLDFTPTFTVPLLLNKDLQLGLDAGRRLGVTMPVASATREILQAHIGLASQRPDAEAYLENDFAAVIETLAALSGMKLAPENVHVPNGLEVPVDSPLPD
jgi:3-hydroxyisobutyrate dehydrogenase